MTTREQITIAAAEAGERLDRILAAHLATISRSRLKKLIETGRVSLDGETINDPSMRVKGGQSFIVDLPEPVADRPEPQAMAFSPSAGLRAESTATMIDSTTVK